MQRPPARGPTARVGSASVVGLLLPSFLPVLSLLLVCVSSLAGSVDRGLCAEDFVGGALCVRVLATAYGFLAVQQWLCGPGIGAAAQVINGGGGYSRGLSPTSVRHRCHARGQRDSLRCDGSAGGRTAGARLAVCAAPGTQTHMGEALEGALRSRDGCTDAAFLGCDNDDRLQRHWFTLVHVVTMLDCLRTRGLLGYGTSPRAAGADVPLPFRAAFCRGVGWTRIGLLATVKAASTVMVGGGGQSRTLREARADDLLSLRAAHCGGVGRTGIGVLFTVVDCVFLFRLVLAHAWPHLFRSIMRTSTVDNRQRGRQHAIAVEQLLTGENVRQQLGPGALGRGRRRPVGSWDPRRRYAGVGATELLGGDKLGAAEGGLLYGLVDDSAAGLTCFLALPLFLLVPSPSLLRAATRHLVRSPERARRIRLVWWWFPGFNVIPSRYGVVQNAAGARHSSAGGSGSGAGMQRPPARGPTARVDCASVVGFSLPRFLPALSLLLVFVSSLVGPVGGDLRTEDFADGVLYGLLLAAAFGLLAVQRWLRDPGAGATAQMTQGGGDYSRERLETLEQQGYRACGQRDSSHFGGIVDWRATGMRLADGVAPGTQSPSASPCYWRSTPVSARNTTSHPSSYSEGAYAGVADLRLHFAACSGGAHMPRRRGRRVVLNIRATFPLPRSTGRMPRRPAVLLGSRTATTPA